MTTPIFGTGAHCAPAELATVGRWAQQNGTTRSRVLRAALALADEAEDQELRAAVGRLDALHGTGKLAPMRLSLEELERLTGMAERADTSRSKLVRAALELFGHTDDDLRRRLIANLPPDRRRAGAPTEAQLERGRAVAHCGGPGSRSPP